MTTLFRWLSGILFMSSLAAMLALLISDAWNGLAFTTIHRQAGALSLMLIGSSYIALQFSCRRTRLEKVKAVLLGTAFLFWGSVQFLSPGKWVTVMDSAVIVIFVVDLGLIIVESLRRNQL